MFERKKCYRLVNKVSVYGLLAGDWGTNPNDRNVWQYPLSEIGKNRDGFMWLLIPAEEDYYWIINKVSGYGLLAGAWGTDPNDRSVRQYPLSETGKNANGFLWKIKKSNGRVYQIINKVSEFGLFADTPGPSLRERAVRQMPLSETGLVAEGFLWDIDFTSVLPFKLTTEPGTEPNNIGDVDRITRFGHIPKEETDPVVIGEVLIPFFYVKDDSTSSQITTDPYYKFKREGFWRRVFYYEHAGNTEKEEKQETKTGLIRTSSKTIEDTTGIKVTAHASFSYGGLCAKFKADISASFSKEIKVTTSTSETEMKEETKTITQTFPKGKRFAQAVWMRGDRYTLGKLSGKSILEFETINHEEIIEDGFPSEVKLQHDPVVLGV
ncbi:MAG TPA: hypothetical protein VMW72_15155 [Sedimentisphaerales bacterium]|nr:hypothetical protein [Sedimentisphaerales bacterium]